MRTHTPPDLFPPARRPHKKPFFSMACLLRAGACAFLALAGLLTPLCAEAQAAPVGKTRSVSSPALLAPGKSPLPARPYIMNDLPAWGLLPTPGMPFDPSQDYVLTGSGLQGLYQTRERDVAWTLSQPERILSVQLIKRGASPEVVTQGVRIFWELGPEVALTPSPVVGEDSPSHRGNMALAEDGLSFTAAIPVTARQSNGIRNPYPVARFTATDASGKVLASSAAVLAVSPGFGCASCHKDDQFAILAAHDRGQKTKLQAQARKGAAVACRSCHTGLDANGPGKGLSVSAAIHASHAPRLAGKKEESCLSCHIGLGVSAQESKTALAANRALPPRPLFARDVHTERGLNCTHCHGALEDHALALLAAEKEAGQALAAPLMRVISPRSAQTIADIAPRLPWKQEPDCAGCHDFTAKPRPNASSAFNHWTKSSEELFSMRTDDTGSLRCVTCHGAPHALYPARNPVSRDRDNIAPLQYQQHARPLGAAGNCAMCHVQDMDNSAHHPLVERSRTDVHLPEGVKLSLPPVRFSHQAHAQVSCTLCHHTGYEDGKSLRCTTAGCHDQTALPASPGAATAALSVDAFGAVFDKTPVSDADPRYFRSAFHGRGHSCFACHAESRQSGKPAGPIECKDCHTAPSARWTLKATSNSAAVPAKEAPETPKETPSSPGAAQEAAPEAQPPHNAAQETLKPVQEAPKAAQEPVKEEALAK